MVNSDPASEFDSQYYLSVNRARDEVFMQFLPHLIEKLGLRTAIDIGCGVGYYTKFLCDLGLTVIGVDGRPKNVEAATLRYPQIKYLTADVEEISLSNRGTFDMVFCAGLLYHLENPFKALRNIRRLCTSVCVVESRVHWTDFPGALLVRDAEGASQALRSYAFVLSRETIVRMLYVVGFEYVYSVEHKSNHEELRSSMFKRSRRHFFVASTNKIDLPCLSLESRTSVFELCGSSPYIRNWKFFVKAIRETFFWI